MRYTTVFMLLVLFFSNCSRPMEKTVASPLDNNSSAQAVPAKTKSVAYTPDPNSLVKDLDTDGFKTMIVDYTKDEYQYLGKKGAIVDFYADWCEPCKVSSPYIDKLADKYDGKIDFYRIDTDKDTEPYIVFAQLARTNGIPFFLFFYPDGKVTYLTGWGEGSEDMFEDIIQGGLIG